LGTSKDETNKQARAQVQSYIRRLLGSGRQSSGNAGTSSAAISLPKSSGASKSSGTPHTLPRQLEATPYTRTSTRASSGGRSGVGNLWLISPIASTVKSLFNLFGGGSSSSQSTRYKTRSRVPFHLVESIAPETGSGTNSLNESAAGLTGITSQSLSSGSGTSPLGGTDNGGFSMLMNNRQELVTALRRGLSESRGIADVLTEFQDGL
jgi:hypothetical protein